MFLFGDSLVDDGNNNYLNSLAKANNPPYGIDFSRGATGKFNNSKTVIDLPGSARFGTQKILVGRQQLGPLGCNLNQLAGALVSPGQCISLVNDITQLFNARLRLLVDQLNADHHEQFLFMTTLLEVYQYVFWDAFHPSQ
ncbi:hypothetical protein L6164_006124 [Bauhinia variegata]|uniref:Uncharacterized protein n=1 Tax=Bauhinia variegata TaxID=167791 RepID=A0ACB9PW50_BAUVA|nr:hypothetical protein L6164_006124 [Bauhinia variegata]